MKLYADLGEGGLPSDISHHNFLSHLKSEKKLGMIEKEIDLK